MKRGEIVEVSKEEFAEALYYWLSENLKTDDIKTRAKEFEFQIKREHDFHRILMVLTILNMWMVVDTCEALFLNKDLKNECLDLFHHLVYKRNVAKKENIDFDTWLKTTALKYIDYSEAMETPHPPKKPLWEIAKVFNKNLFGENKKDFWFQWKAEIYIGVALKHLGEAIKKYSIVHST